MVGRQHGTDRRAECAVGIRELGDVAEGRHDPGRALLVGGVLGVHDRAAGVLVGAGDRQVVQVVLEVVAADQHLEQRLAGGQAVDEPVAEEADELLGDRGQRVDPRLPVGSARVGERLDLGGDALEDGAPLVVDQRLVEPAEPDRAGEVADDGEPQLGGADHPLQQRASGRGVLGRRRRVAEPALEHADRDVDVGRVLLGEEDAEHRPLQLRGALQVGHAVVGEHALQLVAEVVRQRAPVGVEAAQVGVEVLARAVHAQLGRRLVAGGPVAAELGEVGEQ
ncbi:hypothetical protein [Nocardioides albidus]|uniref:hypothetical protein n=1 Tax=Nocardioides albidus TaxID=1517589 RepID=UPI001F003FA2|nr:hypothetical protein [Nocardioides albidus]